MSSYVQYVTKPCIKCKKQGTLTLWADDLDRYLNGALVQDAFPDLHAPIREQIISGTHPQCFVELFSPDDEVFRIQGDNDERD